MRSGKRHTTDGIELLNQDRIRTLGENDASIYLGILAAETIKQVQIKDKIQENISGELGNYSRQNSLLILIKGMNTWAVLLVRYSGPFLKWTRDELKQMDQSTRKLMTMHKALHPRESVDILYISRKELGEEDLPASKTASTHRYNGSRTTYKNTNEDWLQPSETTLTTR